MKHRVTKMARIAILVLIVFLIALAGFGGAVLYLWNWLMPDLFGLHSITYWQALGLLGLSWILFRAGFLGRPRRTFGDPHEWERWRRMTPEQREKFRKGLDCGHFDPHPEEPKAG